MIKYDNAFGEDYYTPNPSRSAVKRSLRVLRRRRDFLQHRIDNLLQQGVKSVSYDKEELRALNVVIDALSFSYDYDPR